MTRRTSRPRANEKEAPRHSRRSKGAKRRQKRSGKRRSWLLRFVAFCVVCSVVFAGGLLAWSFSSGAVAGEPGHVVHFRVTHSSKDEVIDALESEGLLVSPLLTELYARFMTPTADFRPRAHLLTTGISARELVQRLAQQGSRPSSKVTFPEGWTHLQMAERLEQHHICSARGFEAAVADRELLDELRLSGPSAEGFLFPAQYQLAVDTDPRDVVRRLVKVARQRYEALLREGSVTPDIERLSFGEVEIFTLASIVEKETSVATEAPRIARVFFNRLLLPDAETKGRLQSDPTAGYGCLVDPGGPASCQKYGRHIRPEMLADAENPYNTYRHPGLPPGPISNPGERSLKAVLRPSTGDELYFVADGKGGHTFSSTFSEHRKAVEKLRGLRGREKKH